MPLSRSLAATACALLITAAPAAAQTIRIKGQPIVHLLDQAGTEHTGLVIGSDDRQVILLIGDRERRFEHAGIRRLEKRGDSLKNGLLIGTATGLALSTSFVRGECIPWGNDCAAWRALYAGITTGLGALVGVIVDSLHQGRTLLYQAPSSDSARTWSAGIRPMHGGAAVHVTLRFDRPARSVPHH